MTDNSGKLPILNTMRVPLFNSPAPHILRMMNPERLFCKLTHFFKESCAVNNNSNFVISVLGDPRTNQNPALLSFGVLLMRWHNVIAGRVQKDHPSWSDEEVFHSARRIVIASLQVCMSY